MSKTRTDAKLIADALRAFADLIEHTDAAHLHEFVQALKSGKIEIIKQTNSRDAPPNNFQRQHSLDLSKVLEEIRSTSTRESAYDVILKHKLSRRQLSEIAKAADIHTTKADDLFVIREKIVESTVGAALNSRAIRGYD